MCLNGLHIFVMALPCRTWGYKLSLVQEALRRWIRTSGLELADTFLYCCFFCNNQYRILVQGNGQGSENLDEVFEKRLTNIGRVIALLDTWDNPRYLTRIWTIYEQFTAAKLNISMTMILPPEAHESLMEKLREGDVGIKAVTTALRKVDSENAEAFSPDDKEKVKGKIRESLGFKGVNDAVAKSMIKWIVAVKYKLKSYPTVRYKIEVIERTQACKLTILIQIARL